MCVSAPSNWTHLIRIADGELGRHEVMQRDADLCPRGCTARVCHVSIDAAGVCMRQERCKLRRVMRTPNREQSWPGAPPPLLRQHDLIALLAEAKRRQFKFESTLGWIWQPGVGSIKFATCIAHLRSIVTTSSNISIYQLRFKAWRAHICLNIKLCFVFNYENTKSA